MIIRRSSLDRIFKNFDRQYLNAYTTSALAFEWSRIMVVADARCRCRIAGAMPSWAVDWIDDEHVGMLITCSVCGSSWSRFDAVPHKKRKRRRRSC